MENYIIELISVAGTFIAAYLGSLWALKNVKKEKYFEERSIPVSQAEASRWRAYYLL